MGSTLMEALVVGLIVGGCYFANILLTRSQLDSPLLICTLVGLAFGNLTQGIILGAALQTLFLGSFSVGNAFPPNYSVGSGLACAFAIKAGMGAEVALTLAMPIAVLAGALQNVVFSLVSIGSNAVDRAAAEGNIKKIYVAAWITGFLSKFFYFFIITFSAYALGVDAVQAALGYIPMFVLNGLKVAAGLIPAVGIGLLLKMVYKSYLVPYFFIGFILAAYLKLPIMGIALLGGAFVLVKYDFLGVGVKAAAGENVLQGSVGGEEDDDF